MIDSKNSLPISLYVAEPVEPTNSDFTCSFTIPLHMHQWETLPAKDNLVVVPYGSRETLIHWAVPIASERHIIVLQKSDNTESGWRIIAKKKPTDIMSFLDTDANNTFSNHAESWYRVLIYGTNKIIGPLGSRGVADPYGAEIARRHAIRLSRGRSGNLMYLFVRVKNGVRCPTCWDEIIQKRVRSDCPSCIDTGWLNGYYDPYPIYVSVGVEKETIDHTLDGSSNTDNKIQAWTSNYPILNNGDIIIEPRSRNLWCVVDREFSTHKRIITKQNLVLDRLDGDDPVWKLVHRLPGVSW